MIFYVWFLQIKSALNKKFNRYQELDNILQQKRLKAAEEIKNLEHFTQWPIATAKVMTLKKNIDSKNKLHYLPFVSYKRKKQLENQLSKSSIKLKRT